MENDPDRIKLARIELAKRELERRQSQPTEPSLLERAGEMPGKVWDALAVPSQISRSGLEQLSEITKPTPEFTGNLARDVVKNYPSFSADVLSKVAPGFISRGSLITGAVSSSIPMAGRVLAPVGKWLAGTAEDWSGVKPGALVNAAKDASLLFAKGKKSASNLYESGKTGGKMAENLKNIPLKDDLLDVASKLADEGKLPPEIALEGRKIAGKLLSKGGGKYTEDFLRSLISKFDSIAKSSEGIAKGDIAYQRGIQAESMRKLFPSNASGRASPMKVGEAGWLASILGGPGKILAAGTSPIVQGVTATLGGALGRAVSNPELAMTARQALITAFVTKRGNQ